MSTAPKNAGPLSQSAVASFVFSSIQLTITAVMFIIAYTLNDIMKGFTGATGSTASSGFNPNMSGGDFQTAVILSAFGIIGALAGLLAIGSISSNGKTGLALVMSSFLMSFTCIALNFYPVFAG